MGILSWVIIGALLVVGIVGGIIGGVVTSLLGGESVTGFIVLSLLVAVVGAVIFLWVVGAIRKKT